MYFVGLLALANGLIPLAVCLIAVEICLLAVANCLFAVAARNNMIDRIYLIRKIIPVWPI